MTASSQPEGMSSIAGPARALAVRSWRPGGAARAVLAFCPGFNSHSGYFHWFGSQCAAAGLAVHVVDLRGRGRSEGERFYADSFDDYVADFAALVDHARAAEPGAPLFIMGHSAGAVVAALYTVDHQSEVAGLVCEDIAFELPAPDFALAVLKGLSHVTPHHHGLTLKNADFSGDPAAVAAMDADPLIAGESQPFATAAAIVRADAKLKGAIGGLAVPALFIHGTADKAAKASGSQHLFEQAGSADKLIKLYEGRYHDPLNDVGKEEVAADILAWIAARLG